MKETVAKLVAARVRQLRASQGLSQERLAELAQLSRDAVSRIERANRHPRLETLEALSDALGISLSDFLAIETGKPKSTDEHQQRISRVDRHLRSVEGWLSDRIVAAIAVLCTPGPEERPKGRGASPRKPSGPGGKRGRRSRSPGDSQT